jgi:oxygen-dependent protoporphyrinogen oxidase
MAGDVGVKVPVDAAPVAVIGSGPSGLAAAYRLYEAGYRVKIFDDRDYLGGKVSSIHRDGFVIDDGAGVITTTYHSLMAIARDSGFADNLVPAGATYGFARDGVVHNLRAERMAWDALTTKLLSTRSKLAMVKLVRDLLRVRPKLDYEDLSRAADFDVENAEQYSHRRLNPELLEYVIEPSVRALVGAPAKDLANLDLLFSLDKFIGANYVAFRDGMGSYPRHLAQFFEVHLNARVVGVEEDGEEVTVTWRGGDGAEHAERVAGAVLAVPAPVTAEIHTRLDSERRDVLKGVRYTQGVNVTIASSRKPRNQPAVYIQVPPSSHEGIGGILLEHNKAPGRAPEGKGLTGLYTLSDYAGRMLELDDEAITNEMVDGAEKIIPGISQDIEFTMVSRWDPMVLMAHTGFWKQMREFNKIRKARDTRIQLAGDYFASSNVNTASVAGERAARELVAALR